MSQFPETSSDATDALPVGPLIARSIARQLNDQDLNAITATQRESLSRFEKTNEMLTNCNTLSMTRLTAAVKELQPYRQMLTEMKRDLDAIFRRIRIYKQNFAQAYPEAYTAAQQMVVVHATPDDNDEEMNTTEKTEPEQASKSEDTNAK